MTETDRSRAGYPRPQDFPEDAQYENGSCCCRCSQCGHLFIGFKHRVACKLCKTVQKLTDERDALKVELRTARKERDSAHEGWEHNQMLRGQAERERDALLEDAVRMRATGDALYDGMDCQACRISIGIEFCAQCEADREQWCNLAPIIARTAEALP